MLRSVYKGVVRLHPPAFRHRFGDEMLLIFDVAESHGAEFRLLVDGIFSLGRQWLVSPRFRLKSALTASAGSPIPTVPSFATLDAFRPQTSAILDGLILSIALFCFTCFAIRYSWIHVLHVHIPEVEAVTYLPLPSPAVVPRVAGSSLETRRNPEAASAQKDEIAPHLQVQALPVEAGSAASAFEATAGASPVVSNIEVQPLKGTRPVHLDLHSYEGIYVCSSPRFKMTVTAEDGNLAVRIDDQPAQALSSLSATTFVIDGTNDRIEFDEASDGVVHQLRLLQGNQRYTATRQ